MLLLASPPSDPPEQAAVTKPTASAADISGDAMKRDGVRQVCADNARCFRGTGLGQARDGDGVFLHVAYFSTVEQLTLRTDKISP